MKTLLRVSFSLIFCVVTLVSVAQTNRPFSGSWYSPEMYININFYDKNVPDPNSMDDDPCPGTIKMSYELGGCTYTIESVKITGNKAVGKVYCAEGYTTVTLTYLPNGTMTFNSPNFTYVPKYVPNAKGEGIGKLSKLPCTLQKASPFAGIWKMKNDTGTLTLNLYDKCILGQDNEGTEGLYYGTIYILRGQRMDNCMIIDRKISNNQATIDYIGGRDGHTYRSTFVYNPANKQISIKDTQLLKKGEIAMEECYVCDGLIFYRK